MLEHALTHKSKAHEDATGGVVDNESLEFLGDAVLGFVIADLLYREFPQFQEGQKSKAKAAMVSTAALAALAERIGLGEYLLLGRGEEKTGGRRKQALLADGCEALIAALYLDGGIEAARTLPAQRTGRRDRARPLARLPVRLQVGAAGTAAVIRPPAAGLRRDRRSRPGTRQALPRHRARRRRRAGRIGRQDEEGSGAGGGQGGAGEMLTAYDYEYATGRIHGCERARQLRIVPDSHSRSH